MTRTKSESRSLWPTVLLILAVLVSGEIFCRALDAYDGWKKYHDLLAKTVLYRGQSYSISKPAGVTRIILLGGSAVHDTVKDYKESWPYALEQKLKSVTGKKIELINMGFYSESSIDELFKLNEFGLDLDPDIVIVFDGQNDVYNAFHHFDYYKRLYELKDQHILHEKKRNPVTHFFQSLRKQSSLYKRLNWVKKNLTLLLSSAAEVPSADLRKEGASPSAEESSSAADNPFTGVEKGPSEEQFFEDSSRWPEITEGYLAIYQDNLNKMARLIGKAGAKGLFVFQPDLSYKPFLTGAVTEAERQEFLRIIGRHEKDWASIQGMTYGRAEETMRDAALKQGLEFEDFNKLLFRDAADVSGLFDGNVHFSKAGRERVAEETARILLSRKLL